LIIRFVLIGASIEVVVVGTSVLVSIDVVVAIEAVVLGSKVVVVLSDMIEVTFDESSVEKRTVEASSDDVCVSPALCEVVIVTVRSSVEGRPPVVRPVTVAA